MSGAVLFDGCCGEPIAWARVGESVIGHEWTEHGRVALTERLTPAEVVRRYGPIAEVVLGPKGDLNRPPMVPRNSYPSSWTRGAPGYMTIRSSWCTTRSGRIMNARPAVLRPVSNA
jgi:hypothetical protein